MMKSFYGNSSVFLLCVLLSVTVSLASLSWKIKCAGLSAKVHGAHHAEISFETHHTIPAFAKLRLNV